MHPSNHPSTTSLRRRNRISVPNPKYTAAYTPHRLNAMLNADTDKLEEYRHLVKEPDKKIWEEANCREIGRLCNGRISDNSKGNGSNAIK